MKGFIFDTCKPPEYMEMSLFVWGGKVSFLTLANRLENWRCAICMEMKSLIFMGQRRLVIPCRVGYSTMYTEA